MRSPNCKWTFWKGLSFFCPCKDVALLFDVFFVVCLFYQNRIIVWHRKILLFGILELYLFISNNNVIKNNNIWNQTWNKLLYSKTINNLQYNEQIWIVLSARGTSLRIRPDGDGRAWHQKLEATKTDYAGRVWIMLICFDDSKTDQIWPN